MCDLSVVGVFEFTKTEDGRDVFASPVSIFRVSLGRSARTLAIVDTGFDLGMLTVATALRMRVVDLPIYAHQSVLFR